MTHGVRVRITATPHPSEIDGVKLDKFTPGEIREVSISIGSWLIAEGYAEPEMRRQTREAGQDGHGSYGLNDLRSMARDRRRDRKS